MEDIVVECEIFSEICGEIIASFSGYLAVDVEGSLRGSARLICYVKDYECVGFALECLDSGDESVELRLVVAVFRVESGIALAEVHS